jgi:osmotically-inducible protein OsmY
MDSFPLKFNRLIAAPALAAALCAACGHSADRGTAAPDAAAKQPTGALPARLVADFSSGKVTLMGSLPSEEAHRRVLDRAKQLYGAAHVGDEIAVDPRVAPAPWLSTDAVLLPLVDNTISEGQSAFDGQRLTLTGEVRTETMRAQIADRVAKAAPSDVKVENHLQVMQ